VEYGPHITRREIQFTCPNKAGYSGSPLLHEEKVIGILGRGAYQASLAVCTEFDHLFGNEAWCELSFSKL
jgi:hypothetical protein